MQTSHTTVLGMPGSRVISSSPRVISTQRTLMQTPVTKVTSRPVSISRNNPVYQLHPVVYRTLPMQTLPMQHHINLSPLRANIFDQSQFRRPETQRPATTRDQCSQTYTVDRAKETPQKAQEDDQ